MAREKYVVYADLVDNMQHCAAPSARFSADTTAGAH